MQFDRAAHNSIPSQEDYLQTLNHRFIDIARLTYDQSYEEFVGGYSEVKVATLDSGTPTAKLVAAKRLRLGKRGAEPKRLAYVSTPMRSMSAARSHDHFDSDWLASSRSGLDSSILISFPCMDFILPATINRLC